MLPEPFADTSVAQRLRDLDLDLEGVNALPGDVSPRCYWRLFFADSSAILAFYPEPITGVCQRFLATGRLLAAAGVRVPRVLTAACDEGWMLVEDLGGETLFGMRGDPWEDLAPYYRDAVEAIRRVGSLDRSAVEGLSPALDGSLLRSELEQTWDFFLTPEGNLGSVLEGQLREAFEEICCRLGAFEPQPCHRDFMVRNLVPRESSEGLPEVVVIDHQDLRLGPPFYDLASLLNDSLFPPSAFKKKIAEALLASDDDWSAYHLAAVQRTFKAVGTFAKFGSDRHRRLIPSSLVAALGHLRRLPFGASLGEDLERHWPRLLQKELC